MYPIKDGSSGFIMWSLSYFEDLSSPVHWLHRNSIGNNKCKSLWTCWLQKAEKLLGGLQFLWNWSLGPRCVPETSTPCLEKGFRNEVTCEVFLFTLDLSWWNEDYVVLRCVIMRVIFFLSIFVLFWIGICNWMIGIGAVFVWGLVPNGDLVFHVVKAFL